MRSSGEPISPKAKSSGKALWLVYAGLMILLALTVVVAFMPLGRINLLMAGVIAVAKAALIVWFFMHFRESQSLVGVLFGASLFMLAVAAILGFTDYLTRG